MDKDVKAYSSFFLAGLLISTGLFVWDYLLRLGYRPELPAALQNISDKVISTVREKETIFRLLHVLLLSCIFFFRRPQLSETSKQVKQLALIFSVLFAGIFLVGYLPSYYYNVWVSPFLFFGLFFSVPTASSLLGGLESSKPDKVGINRKRDKKWSWELKLKGGKKLAIYNARQGTFIEAKPGGGKTELLLQIIDQVCKKGFAGVLYDYEGDFTEEGGFLTNVTYTLLKKYNTQVKFAFINFTDASRTVQVNLFSDHYLRKDADALEIATTLLYNLNPDLKNAKDPFWKDNAVIVLWATILFFKRNHPEFCTYPHICEFLLHHFPFVIYVLNRDPEINKILSPVNAAFNNEDAGSHQAGIQASIQMPLLKARLKEVYYVFNPPKDKEFSLDITDRDYPVLLSVGGCPGQALSISPAVSAILQVCLMNMNRLGKQKSVLLVDESPTVYINSLDKLINEARKKGVCTVITAQTRKQKERIYGKETAGIILDGMGNQFTGFSSTDSGKYLTDAFGKYDKMYVSKTQSDASNSQSQSVRRENLLDPDDVAFQDTGHFTGVIAGGKPPRFSEKLDRLKLKKVEELPRFAFQAESQEIAQQLHDRLVEENFRRVQQEVEDILALYRPNP